MILYYRIEVDDKDGAYDLEAILETGIDYCNLTKEEFEILAVEVEDAE